MSAYLDASGAQCQQAGGTDPWPRDDKGDHSLTSPAYPLRHEPRVAIPAPLVRAGRTPALPVQHADRDVIIVAAVVSTCTLRNVTEDPRARTGLKVSVVDGDSFRAAGEPYRLTDIDAPELSQTCKDARGATWSCGYAARDRLIALTLRGAVTCTPRGRDQFGRVLARCSALGVKDIGETLVQEGIALDFGRGAGTYHKAERIARDARLGLWQGDFDRPQDWRRKHPRS